MTQNIASRLLTSFALRFGTRVVYRLTSIEGLEGLTGLSELYLSHNLIESAEGLESQVHVEYIVDALGARFPCVSRILSSASSTVTAMPRTGSARQSTVRVWCAAPVGVLSCYACRGAGQ